MDTSFYNDLILKKINFSDGYGSSETWIGYFGSINKFSFKNARKAILFFSNYFAKDLHDIIIAVSYYIDIDDFIDDGKRIQKIVTPIEDQLTKKKFISKLSGNDFFSTDEKIVDKQISELNTQFKVFDHVDKEDLQNLSLLGMVDSNVAGHCFFIIEKYNLIIYPQSDNFGFGCIGINDNANSKGIDFLKSASTDNNFTFKLTHF